MTTSNKLPSSGQARRILKSFYSVIRKGLSALWQLMTRKPQSRPLSNLYTRCNQTPLDVFIDVLVNKNLSRLIRYGRARSFEISEAWETLFTEYCELTGSPQYQRILNLSKEIGSLQSKLLSIQLCIQVLSIRYSSRAITVLRRFGYNYKFEIRNIENYLLDLKAVKTKSKAVEIALEQSLKSYQNLISENDGKQLSEQHFEKQLVELSKFMGFRLNPKEITVSEYVAILKRMEKVVELTSK